ncbi:DUF2934 domain-containing protein [Microbaculum marinum]|uniref:DUF2934 domain-containing protein n=1 Tax=Microbaculum marinum TaxID=1764581 RepID=A0AAW9REZ5_9HYPH
MAEDSDLEKRIDARARHLWEQEGAPAGRQDEFRDMARELIAIEDNPHAAKKPLPRSGAEARQRDVEPIEAVENQGEFPTLTDQGEGQAGPSRKSSS